MSPGPKPNIYPSSLDEFANAADHLLELDRREAAARAAAARPAASVPAVPPLSEPSARDISVTISVRLRQQG